MGGRESAGGSGRLDAEHGDRRAPSFRTQLLALVGLVAATLVALGSLAVWQAHDAARDRAEARLLDAARAGARLIDLEFARAEALLLGLAAVPGLAEADPDAFRAATRRLAPPDDGSVILLAVPPGRVVASSAAAGTAPRLPLGDVFATGRTTITGHQPDGVAAIMLPLPGPAGTLPRAALAMTLPGPLLGAALARQPLPDRVVAGLMDGDGVIVARSRDEATRIGQPGVPGLLAAMARAEEGIIADTRTHDGDASVIAFARAPASGYTAAVAQPEAVFSAERRAALARLGLMALPVATAGIAIALWLGFRLRDALAGLSGASRGARVAEVDDLARALAKADAARAASESALRDRTAWLEAAQQAAAIGTWWRDLRTDELRWSDAMWRLYGLDPEHDGPLTMDLWRGRMVPEDVAIGAVALERARRTGQHQSEVRIIRGDGAIRWIRARGAVEYGDDGAPRFLFGASHDVTEQRLLAQERDARMAEKDLLVQEMHHRVKNSLQLVQSLLLLQARGAEEEVASRLREAAGRIVSIAAVHQRLYEGAPGTEQDVAEHLGALVGDLRTSIGSAGPEGRSIDVLATPGLRLPPERMVALGLLVTELVTNAVKHGAGAIAVRFTPGAEAAVLEVADAGPGFPNGFDPAATNGLGMRVALAMARQLGGTLRVEPGPGGRVVVTLPTGRAG